MKTLYFCDHYEIPLPAGHKFPMEKYRLVRDQLRARGGFAFECAPFAEPAVIRLAHDATYVSQFIEGQLPAAVVRRIGFPWSPGLVQRTLASVGGTLRATEEALDRRWGGNLAGGTHHAFRAEGSGFCVFNDLAVAILWLRHHRGVQRTAVIDLDVHQGDGTAQIFENDPLVLTLSVHGRHNFPFRKQRSKIDVELEDGTGDEEYLRRVEGVLPSIFAFRPEVIFFQGGVDALATDTLGRLALTREGMAARDRLVLSACQQYGAPLVLTLGGGYSKPIERTVEAHAHTYCVAQELFG